MTAAAPKPVELSLELAAPTVADGAQVHQLVCESGTLDPNSPYAYLLLCDRFADTCVVARVGDQVVGFVTAFILPRKPDTVFVWQVGVGAAARGRGVGGRLLGAVLDRPACAGVRFMESTVGPDNTASDALFRGLARRRGAPVEVSPGYPPELFPGAAHAPELLYRIGPFPAPTQEK